MPPCINGCCFLHREAAAAEGAAARAFLADLSKNCATEELNYKQNQKLVAEESAGVAEAIRILSQDDALENFKKTLPGSSFIQIDNPALDAAAMLTESAKYGKHPARLAFLATALREGKVSFDKVIKMIDDVVGLLNQEQSDEERQLIQCNKDLENADYEMQDLKRKRKAIGADIDGLTAEIAEAEEDKKNQEAEMKSLEETLTEATSVRS